MAADDPPKPAHDSPEADPWADILAESLTDESDSPSEGGGDVWRGPLELGVMQIGESTSADGMTPLDGVDVAAGFDETMAASDAVSTVEIGTGASGIGFAESDGSSEGSTSSAAGPAEADDLWSVVREADDVLAETAATRDPHPPSAAEGSGRTLTTVAPTVAPVVARDGNDRRPAGERIGRIVGILFGAALAFPVVFGILLGLVWLGGPDTLGIRGALPQSLGFLLPPPPAPVPGAAATGPTAAADAGDLSLDDVAGMVARTVDDEPATDPAEPATDIREPLADAGDRATGDASHAAGVADVSPTAAGPAEPLAASETIDPLASRDMADDHGLGGAAEAASRPLPPAFTLDTTALDAAAARAAAALAVVTVDDEFVGLPAKRRLSAWYRALARVGEELVVLEEAAAVAGRPLASTPRAVVAVHDDIAVQPRLADELGRLGRMWIEASSRDSDGIVVAGVFVGARRLGPWWISTLDLATADGTTRPVSVVSRSVPAVAAGERIVVTGLLVDGGVVWAGDVRPVRPRESAADPFAVPVDDVIPSPGS